MSRGCWQACLFPTGRLLWHKPRPTSHPAWDSHLYTRVPALGSSLIVSSEAVNPFILVASITCVYSTHRLPRSFFLFLLREKNSFLLSSQSRFNHIKAPVMAPSVRAPGRGTGPRVKGGAFCPLRMPLVVRPLPSPAPQERSLVYPKERNWSFQLTLSLNTGEMFGI